MRDVMIRFTAVLSANPAPASAKTRPRQTLRFGDLASQIASSMLTIVLIDNERGGRWEGGEVLISWVLDNFINMVENLESIPKNKFRKSAEKDLNMFLYETETIHQNRQSILNFDYSMYNISQDMTNNE